MGTVAGTVVGKIFFLTLDYMSVNLYLCIVKKRGAGAEGRQSPPLRSLGMIQLTL